MGDKNPQNYFMRVLSDDHAQCPRNKGESDDALYFWRRFGFP